MSTLGNNPNQERDINLINSWQKRSEKHQRGTYYNDNYAIENFVNVFLDSADTDSFKVLNDPTFIGFKLFFHFDKQSGLLADERFTNSALAYLKRIGEEDRYQLLIRFINVLSKVNSICPWIFQSVTGLDDLWVKPHIEVYYQKELTLGTLETIDGKISSLISMYREIAYDWDRHVWILPINLRRFSFSLYLYDFRNFDNTSETSVNLLQTIENQDIKQLNHHLFDFGYCQFDIKSGSEYIGSVNNIPGEAAKNNLTIIYEKSHISSLFKSITGNTEINSKGFSNQRLNNAIQAIPEIGVTGETQKFRPQAPFEKLFNRVQDTVENLTNLDYRTVIGNIRTQAEDRIIDLIENRITRLLLGNVNGFGLDDLIRFGQKDDPEQQEAIANIYATISGNQSLSNYTREINRNS